MVINMTQKTVGTLRFHEGIDIDESLINIRSLRSCLKRIPKPQIRIEACRLSCSWMPHISGGSRIPKSRSIFRINLYDISSQTGESGGNLPRVGKFRPLDTTNFC